MDKTYAVATQNNQLPDLAAVAGTLYSISKKSRETYKHAMSSYRKYCESKNIPQNMDTLVQWLESQHAPSTKLVYTAAIKKILCEVFRFDPRLQGILYSLSSIKKPKPDKTVTTSKYLTKSEVDTLIKAMPKKYGLIVSVLFWTGLRISECLNIELSKCTLVKCEVIDSKIKDKKKQKKIKEVYEIRVIGKGNKAHTVYVTKELFTACNKLFQGKVFLFEHEGVRFTREHVTRTIMHYSELTGKKISAHKLRHSKGMFLKDEMGLSIEQIQRALNHSNMSTTADFYIHGKPDASAQGII